MVKDKLLRIINEIKEYRGTKSWDLTRKILFIKIIGMKNQSHVKVYCY